MTILPGSHLYGKPGVHKFGANFDIDTGTPEDVWSAGGDYTGFVALAAASTIVSDSAADAAAGTGARTVTVFGLNSSYLEVSETATLNGVTAVNLTNQYLRVYRAFVLTAGSGATNAGNITVKIDAAAAAHIAAGYGQTLQATYTIPASYNGAQILGWYAANAGTNTATYATIALQARPFGGAWQTKELVVLTESNKLDQAFRIPQIYAPKTDIKVRVTVVGANNTGVAAGFDMLLGV